MQDGAVLITSEEIKSQDFTVVTVGDLKQLINTLKGISPEQQIICID
jgi:hypothetical protein